MARCNIYNNHLPDNFLTKTLALKSAIKPSLIHNFESVMTSLYYQNWCL